MHSGEVKQPLALVAFHSCRTADRECGANKKASCRAGELWSAINNPTA